MSDAREALVALILERFRAAETYMDLPRQAGLLADAIQSAGWTPPGEHVKPSVEDVARALADDWNPDRDPILTAMFRDYAQTVLALLPGRTETEIKAEALREAQDELVRRDAFTERSLRVLDELIEKGEGRG